MGYGDIDNTVYQLYSDFLNTKLALNSETIQKINEYLISPNIIKYAVNVLINEIENLNRELAGDMLNDWAEKF